MKQFLRITVRFLVPEPTFHGQRDGGEPEWPPSPLRLFQAIVDAAANRWRRSQFGEYAQPLLEWLERLGPPEIVAPTNVFGTPFRLSGPNNDMDSPASKWVKGEEPAKPHRPIDLRTMKAVIPTHIRIGEGKHDKALHYLFTIPDGQCPHLENLRTAARSITHLGWGIDMAVGDVDVLDAERAVQLEGVRWHPSSASGTPLRVTKVGTLDDLTRKHADFLNRISNDGFRPVPPLRIFDIIRYRRESDPIPRPQATFKLVDADDDTVSYPQSKLVHVAGMVRHLAIELMKANPPSELRGRAKDEWVEAYVAGHQSKEDKEAGATHTQFSYVPLQSIGHPNTDPGVRRVMIVAPLADDAWLEHLAVRLDGALLKPLANTKLPPGTRLERIHDKRRDGVRDAYLNPSVAWASVTPVILPGHDDHKPDKTHRLIEKALQQSGIDQPCAFEWSAFSLFRKMLPAHKYRKDSNDPSKKIHINYVRPDYLLEQSAVHLCLTFDHAIPGPLTLGAGRHCGFGVMAAVND
jgi:CRISPR-associated protein Csb2